MKQTIPTMPHFLPKNMLSFEFDHLEDLNLVSVSVEVRMVAVNEICYNFPFLPKKAYEIRQSSKHKSIWMSKFEIPYANDYEEYVRDESSNIYDRAINEMKKHIKIYPELYSDNTRSYYHDLTKTAQITYLKKVLSVVVLAAIREC